jgi:malate dehydrogenase
MRDWVAGTPGDDWTSMAVPSDGSYGIDKGLMYSFPVRCKGGDYEIVQGLPVDDFSRARMTATENELKEERDAIQKLVS